MFQNVYFQSLYSKYKNIKKKLIVTHNSQITQDIILIYVILKSRKNFELELLTPNRLYWIILTIKWSMSGFESFFKNLIEIFSLAAIKRLVVFKKNDQKENLTTFLWFLFVCLVQANIYSWILTSNFKNKDLM